MKILYILMWLFFIYSILGWILGTITSSAKNKKFINKGFYNGPWCTTYGFVAIAISIGFNELHNNYIFLFIGCTVVATFFEWLTGKLLELTNNRRWWDYSNKKWNYEGYICLQYSLLWGLLGVIGLKIINPFLIKIYNLIPGNLMIIILWIVAAIVIIDAIGSYFFLRGIQDKFPRVEEINHALTSVSVKVGKWISNRINNRVTLAYPSIKEEKQKKVKSNIFAFGCSFYKLVILFFIGAFLGDIIETVFCRFTMGYWMSRSSVVWGPFSIVWGLAITLATTFLYNQRGKSDGYLFLIGTVLGGVYEYLCSVFTELAFGKVFWDYSDIPFNLGGRINLLYCFFWGIAAVLWIKKAYPFISGIIEKFPMRAGKIASWTFIIFMLCNMTVSTLALARYTARDKGIAAQNSAEQWADKHFDDQRMVNRYPNAITKEDSRKIKISK